MNLRGKSHLLVSVSKNRHSEEYKKIQTLFQTTLSGVDITKLERVQNETCWDLYSRQKEVMMKKNPSKPVQERLLFHGTTPEKVEDICRDNFDFRLSGTRVGAVYGQGAYFASTSKYSDSYAEADGYNVKKMFVARVLVGSYTTGTRDMRRPPYKNSSDKTKGMYDSCVDNTSNPSIFVVFDNHQVYPEYVITYSTSSANQTFYSSTNQTSSYNPYTAAARYAYSASQTSDTSTSQRNSFNSYTSTTARRAYSASQTSYTGTSQRNSYTPSTSTTARSTHSANQTSYSSTNQPSSYNYPPSLTASSTSNQASSSRPSSSTSSSRNSKSSCVCM
ncbi:protein mono-ADP-ribosyltransferase PARP12-like [Anneissia japonica]|uniref:protein mono-ADP-ribosyltransferase PARP12-like n=1 Tax=Anneissia japonica TaxID=1529436 RepID=UPI001425AD37|nr:protein mono-ADP-ribosyltransferase PARP12-like [Anneissia japonica]